MLDREVKQLPESLWEVHDVVFSVANTDVTVTHNLNPSQAWEVRFIVVDATAGGVVFRGTRAPDTTFITLQATVAGRYRLRLFTEAGQSGVKKL